MNRPSVFVRARILVAALLTVIVSGTIFFHFVENWSWIDSYFFTVVTLSTVGYGNLVPATVLGKIGATVFIFTGLGVFAIAIRGFGEFAFHRRIERLERQEQQDHQKLMQQDHRSRKK
jgi:voltage-gated potassium channel